MSSTKRACSPTSHNLQQQPNTKRSKNESFDETQQSLLNSRVLLNPADSNLDFDIEGDGLIGHALHTEGFAYCWSGARGNTGITGGKYYFGCKIVSHQLVQMEDTPIDQQNVCRIGISRGDDPVGNLGETPHSYGFGGTGKFSNAGKFSDYGERFGVGDTIVCLVDLESNPLGSLEFCKNGKRLGIARHLNAGPNGLGLVDSPPQKLPWEVAVYPHVLLKNVVVQMQFSLDDGLAPVEGFKPWDRAVKDGKVVTGPSFYDPTDCEVLMMVGLPAAGKSTWAENWMKEHPEKRYVLLGTNLALDQMKVPGLLRKGNYGERFDRLMDRATGIFNTLLSRASKVPRNYILDQTNVYKSARKRKLKPFASYKKIAVVIFPKQEELKSRAGKQFQEMGKEVPPEAVNEMLANFVLPMSKDMRGADEYFDVVTFTELDRVEAQQHLNEMKRTLALSSVGKPKTDHSPYSRESSVHSDSRMSAYSVPGSGYLSSGYSSLAARIPHDASFGGPSVPAMQPCPVNVSAGYAGYGQSRNVEPVRLCLNENIGYGRPGILAREEPFTGSCGGSSNQMPSQDAYHGAYSSCASSAPREDLVRPSRDAYHGAYSSYAGPAPREDPLLSSRDAYNGVYSSYANPAPRHDHMHYDGYTPDPSGRHDGTTGCMQNDTRAAYQPPQDSPYGAPIPRPYGGFQPEMPHPGAPPYGGPPPRYY